MEWKEAHQIIEENIIPETFLKTGENRDFIVTKKNYDGFQINLGNNKSIDLKWFILEHCWKALNERRIFNNNIFHELFGCYCLDEECYAKIVGQVFQKAGLAQLYENVYHNFSDKLYHQTRLPLEGMMPGLT